MRLTRAFVPAAVLPAAALVLLAGCSAPAGPEPGSGADPASSAECAASGSVSESVSFDEGDGTTVSANFDMPAVVDTTERSVLVEGSGEEVRAGDYPIVDISIFNGATGELDYTTGHGAGRSTVLPVVDGQTLSGLVSAIQCSRVGDRVAAVVPPQEGWGSAGNAELGVGPDETVVVVADVLDLYGPPPAAEWEDAPEVDFSTTPPSFQLSGEAPEALLAKVVEEGDGAVVRFGESVSVDYVGKSWDTGEVFDESYSSAPATFSTAEVIAAFSAAIVGKPVGSTVIVVAPPEFAYGEPTGAETDHPLAGQTLVFVVEIREVVAAP